VRRPHRPHDARLLRGRIASAGHKFIAHRKSSSPSAQVSDGGWGLPPHPLAARSGQRYWPRHAKRKLTLQLARVNGTSTEARRVDDVHQKLRVSVDRLLAVRPDGQGELYQFAGFAPRRYSTFAYVAAMDDAQATLVLPEWHPARPASVPARWLPAGSGAGTWLSCRADLSATSAGRLAIERLAASTDPGPAVAHRPTYVPPELERAGDRPDVGPGCGDIVIHPGPGVLASLSEATRRGETARVAIDAQRPPLVYSLGRYPDLHGAGDVYLARDGRIYGRLSFRHALPSPNVLWLILSSPTVDEIHDGPSTEFFDAWQWRWWPLADAS
jgi:hypothetical protein